MPQLFIRKSLIKKYPTKRKITAKMLSVRVQNDFFSSLTGSADVNAVSLFSFIFIIPFVVEYIPRLAVEYIAELFERRKAYSFRFPCF